MSKKKLEETVRKMPEVPEVPSAKLVFAEPTYGIADILEHGSVGQFHPAKICVEIATVKIAGNEKGIITHHK